MSAMGLNTTEDVIIKVGLVLVSVYFFCMVFCCIRRFWFKEEQDIQVINVANRAVEQRIIEEERQI